jgi:chromosome segregation ATPase
MKIRYLLVALMLTSSVNAENAITKTIDTINTLKDGLTEIETFVGVAIDAQMEICKKTLNEYDVIRDRYIKAIEHKRNIIKTILAKLEPTKDMVESKYSDVLARYNELNAFLESLNASKAIVLVK